MSLYDITKVENMTLYNTSILPENMHYINIGDIIKLKVGQRTNNETVIFCRVDSKTNKSITVTDLLCEIIDENLYIFKINPTQYIEPKKKSYTRRNINVIKHTTALENITINNRVEYMFSYLYSLDNLTFSDIITLSNFLDIHLIYDVDKTELFEFLMNAPGVDDLEQILLELDFTTNGNYGTTNQCIECSSFFKMDETTYKNEILDEYKDIINNCPNNKFDDMLYSKINYEELCDKCYELKWNEILDNQE